MERDGRMNGFRLVRREWQTDKFSFAAQLWKPDRLTDPVGFAMHVIDLHASVQDDD